MTNAVNSVELKQLPGIGINNNVLHEGMKLIDVYKKPSLFEAFRTADIDQDGCLSESEMELYDKKEDLKKNAWKDYKETNTLSVEHGLWAGGIVALGTLLHVFGASAIVSVPAAVCGMLLFCGFMYAVTKKQRAAQKYVDDAYAQCQKLDEEYKKKLSEKK